MAKKKPKYFFANTFLNSGNNIKSVDFAGLTLNSRKIKFCVSNLTVSDRHDAGKSHVSGPVLVGVNLTKLDRANA